MLHSEYSGTRLRQLRQRALLSQPEVCRATGIRQSTLSNLECGKARPRTHTLRLLLSLYETRIRSYEARERGWQATEEKPVRELGLRAQRERRAIRKALRQEPPVEAPPIDDKV